MPSTFTSQEMRSDITIYNLKYSVKSFDEYAFVNMVMQIHNPTNFNIEFDYNIPFLYPHKLVSLSVFYKNQKKIAMLNSSELFAEVKFDDEVARGNFSIRLSKIDEIATNLSLANFHRGEKAKIFIQFEVPLFESITHYSFQIPVFDYLHDFLYPNYSFSFQNFSEKNNKIIQFIFNGEDHPNEIIDKNKIVASNVSLQYPLKINILHNNEKINQFSSLNKQKNIILFIDSIALKNQEICTLALNFLNNYGEEFLFNIVKYGENSNYLFNEMTRKSKDSMHEAENFLRNQAPTKLNLNFSYWYRSIFNSFCNRDFYNEIAAVCIGSYKSDGLVCSKKVMTYIVDPFELSNSAAFALRNNFRYISAGNDLEETLYNLLLEIKSSSLQILSEEKRENLVFSQKISLIEKKTCLGPFKKYMDVNKLSIGTSIAKLNSLFEIGDKKLQFEKEDFASFFEKINLGEYIDDLDKMMDENKALYNYIKRLVLIYIFCKNLFDSIFDRETFSIDFFESIEKFNFISFEDTYNFEDEDRYFSLRIMKEKDNEQAYLSTNKLKFRIKPNRNQINYYIDDQSYDACKNNNMKEENKKKSSKCGKENSAVENKTNYSKKDENDKIQEEKSKKEEEIARRIYNEHLNYRYQIEVNKISNSTEFQPQINTNPMESDLGFRFS